MGAGTAGNLAWAEGAAPGRVVEPTETHKEDGIAANECPDSTQWNWLLREHGRAALRRFDTTEALIQARRAGVVAGGGVDAKEDVGIVRATPSVLAARQAFTSLWQYDGGTGLVAICSDGEFLWALRFTGSGYLLQRRSRADGSLIAESPIYSSNVPFLATAGFNVYMADVVAGQLDLVAKDRTTLTQLYRTTVLAAGATGSTNKIATDGKYVAILDGTHVYLYEDTGAALVSIGSANVGVHIYDLTMDGRFIVLGGVDDGSYGIWFYNYTPSFVSGLQRTGGSGDVNEIAWNGRALACIGPVGGGSEDTGYFRGRLNPGGGSPAERWSKLISTANDVALVRGMIAIATSTGGIAFLDPADGECVGLYDHDIFGTSAQVLYLAWDNDALFMLGGPNAGGFTLARVQVRDREEVFEVTGLDPTVATSNYNRPVPSRVYPLFGAGEL